MRISDWSSDVCSSDLGVPEGDIGWSGKESGGGLDEGLDVRLLHVRPHEDFPARPILDQGEPGWIGRVLEHRDAPAFGLRGLNRCDQRGNFSPGGLLLPRERAVFDDHDQSAHEPHLPTWSGRRSEAPTSELQSLMRKPYC